MTDCTVYNAYTYTVRDHMNVYITKNGKKCSGSRI